MRQLRPVKTGTGDEGTVARSRQKGSAGLGAGVATGRGVAVGVGVIVALAVAVATGLGVGAGSSIRMMGAGVGDGTAGAARMTPVAPAGRAAGLAAVGLTGISDWHDNVRPANAPTTTRKRIIRR